VISRRLDSFGVPSRPLPLLLLLLEVVVNPSLLTSNSQPLGRWPSRTQSKLNLVERQNQQEVD
jgi:hypothetical protein